MMDFFESLNRLDIILIIIFVFFVLRGFIKGGISVLFGSAGFVAGFFVAFQYYKALGLIIHSAIPAWNHTDIIGFALLFFLTWFSIGGIGYWIGKVLKNFGLGLIDRLLGALVGFAIALIVSACIITCATLFLPSNHPFIVKSRIAPYSSQGISLMYSLIPDEVKRELIKKQKAVRKYWMNRRSS